MNDERALESDGEDGFKDVAGYGLIPGVIPADWSSRLREEANGLRSTAVRRERQGFELTAEGRMLGALRNWYAGDGPASHDVDELGRLAARLAVWSRELLQPMHSSYLYYARGDHLGLHRDHVSCAVTLLVWLSGPAGPLHIHPELRELDEESLLHTATEWSGHPPGGAEVDLRSGPVVLRGHHVPHDRPPHPHGEELVLSTFCFALAS